MARGFRGVGRCQDWATARNSSSDPVSRERAGFLSYAGIAGGYGGTAILRACASLADVVRDIVSVRLIDGADWPTRFFEVQLNGVIRHRNVVS